MMKLDANFQWVHCNTVDFQSCKESSLISPKLHCFVMKISSYPTIVISYVSFGDFIWELYQTSRSVSVVSSASKLQVDVTRVAHDAAAGASLHRMAAEISLESHGYAPRSIR